MNNMRGDQGDESLNRECVLQRAMLHHQVLEENTGRGPKERA